MPTKMKCKKCHSTHTIKFGFRVVWNKGKKRRVQAYLCQNCGHQFREKTK